MKIITATYGCQYCDFTASSAKVVGKHEHNCEHNQKIKEINIENKFKAEKAYKRKLIRESKSLPELNERLFSYLTEYYSKYNRGNLLRTHGNKWVYTIDVKKGKLSFDWQLKSSLETLGISTKTEDYINLAPLLAEMFDINNKFETYNKEFKNYINPLLIEYKEKNSEIVDLNKGIEHVSKRINELVAVREEYKNTISNIENDYIETVKSQYNWIDYQARVKEIKSILDIK